MSDDALQSRLHCSQLPIALIMAGTEPLYVWLAAPTLPIDLLEYAGAPFSTATSLAPPLWQIGGILVIEQFCGGMATAAQSIFIMRRCHPDHQRNAPADRYAHQQVAPGGVGSEVVAGGHIRGIGHHAPVGIEVGERRYHRREGNEQRN